MKWEELICKRCDHKWYPRTPLQKPKLCPSCKSKYWDEDRPPKSGPKRKDDG